MALTPQVPARKLQNIANYFRRRYEKEFNLRF